MQYPKKFELVGNRVKPVFKLNNMEHVHKLGIGLDMARGRHDQN